MKAKAVWGLAGLTYLSGGAAVWGSLATCDQAAAAEIRSGEAKSDPDSADDSTAISTQSDSGVEQFALSRSAIETVVIQPEQMQPSQVDVAAIKLPDSHLSGTQQPDTQKLDTQQPDTQQPDLARSVSPTDMAARNTIDSTNNISSHKIKNTADVQNSINGGALDSTEIIATTETNSPSATAAVIHHQPQREIDREIAHSPEPTNLEVDRSINSTASDLAKPAQSTPNTADLTKTSAISRSTPSANLQDEAISAETSSQAISSAESIDDPFEQLSTAEWLQLLSDPQSPDPQLTELEPTEAVLSQLTEPEFSRSASHLATESSASRSPDQTQAFEFPRSPQLFASSPDSTLPRLNAGSGLNSAVLRQYGLTANSTSAAPTTISALQLEPPFVPTLVSATPDPSSEHSPNHSETDVMAHDVMAQLTSVSQLSDVQPTDWAYQALQSLVERYGVIEGYPDGLFRGDRALTRYEFAAGVNAALDRVTQLMNNNADAVPQADLDRLNRLQTDYAAELLTLRGRVDGLEARVAELAANQFSTTVVLNGQVTFGLADAWGGDPPGLGETNPVFAYLTQLQLSGSFSKRDAFRIDLSAGNFAGGGFADPQALNTQMALMGWQTDTNSTLDVNGIEYRFAVGDRLVVTLKPVGFSLDTVLSPNSIYTSVSQGALSRFAAENPIFRIGSLDAGVGFDWLITDRLRLQAAYGARDAGDAEQGWLKSDHRALGVQLLARPSRSFTTGITYVNAFASDGFLDTFTGSTNADVSGGFLEPAAIHAVGGTLQWQIVPSVILGAWGGLTVTDSLPSDAVAVSSTYLFSLGFPDTFGREGDLLGVMVGQPLRLRAGIFIEEPDQGSGLHYEVFYRIRVNDHIAITPGVFVVTDPGHVADNDTIVVAAVRTSFLF